MAEIRHLGLKWRNDTGKRPKRKVYTVKLRSTDYWFFSTVAQSFAALLGLVGIFIIFRIQMLKEEFYTTSRSIALYWGWTLDLPASVVIDLLFTEERRIQKEIDELKKKINEENLKQKLKEFESKKERAEKDGWVLSNYIFEQDEIKGLFMFPLFEMSILILSSIVGIVLTPALERYMLYGITLGYILISFVIMFILWALYDFIDIFQRIFYRGGRTF